MASVDKQLLGTETVRLLRSRSVGSIICGLSANDLKDSFLAAGADSFIPKPLPCAVDELKPVLLDILQKSNEKVASVSSGTASSGSKEGS